jgi:hypothetical protein
VGGLPTDGTGADGADELTEGEELVAGADTGEVVNGAAGWLD